MLLGIDHGNYAVKTTEDEFMSGLAEHTVRPPVGDEVLEYGGRFWTLSGKRLNYMRDKTQDERYFILTLFAIARAMRKRGIHPGMETVQLAVGLPPEHYGMLKERFAGYFLDRGTIEFVYSGKKHRICIDRAMVFPQAYAAVVPRSSQIVRTVRVYVVDIGGYTTDVLLLRKGVPDMQVCRSLETGIITMDNEIIRKVGALHDMRIEDEHISAVLAGEHVILPESIKETIRKEAGHHAKHILDQLRELQIDLRVDPAIFLGGGGMLLKPYLAASKMVVQAEFIDDPRANAKGYELLARSSMNGQQGR